MDRIGKEFLVFIAVVAILVSAVISTRSDCDNVAAHKDAIHYVSRLGFVGADVTCTSCNCDVFMEGRILPLQCDYDGCWLRMRP